jgi:hypothetical protein
MMLRLHDILIGSISIAISLPCTGSNDEMPPNIAKLIAAAEEKRALGFEYVEERLVSKDVPKVLSYIEANTGYKSYHLLMALKRDVPDAYEKLAKKTKAAILASALKNAWSIADWSFLSPKESVDDISAEALLELGKEALEYLIPILDDDFIVIQKSGAGGRLKYRRKDFAYRYVALILGGSPAFVVDLGQRDKSIEALKTWCVRKLILESIVKGDKAVLSNLITDRLSNIYEKSLEKNEPGVSKHKEYGFLLFASADSPKALVTDEVEGLIGLAKDKLKPERRLVRVGAGHAHPPRFGLDPYLGPSGKDVSNTIGEGSLSFVTTGPKGYIYMILPEKDFGVESQAMATAFDVLYDDLNRMRRRFTVESQDEVLQEMLRRKDFGISIWKGRGNELKKLAP